MSHRAYWQLLRVKTLTAAFAPLLFSQFWAYQLGTLNLAIAFVVLVCGVSLQLVSNVANDYFDNLHGFDNAQRIGPKRVSQQALLTPAQVKHTLYICVLIALLSGLVLVLYRGVYLLLLGAIALVLALWYSASHKSLAGLGLGELTVFVVFGPLAVLGGFYVQSGFVDWYSVYFSLGFGALAAALMLVNNTRDYHSDKACGKKTLVVRYLGPHKARYAYGACLALSAGAHLLALRSLALAPQWYLLYALSLLPLAILMRVLAAPRLELLMPLTSLAILFSAIALMLDIGLS